MDKVKLWRSDLTVSRLGFGCASLMASLDLDASLRVLSAAYDEGITHFDVARSYGYGEAEAALGAFIRGRRDQVTITTKFGILPPDRRLAQGGLKDLARGVAKAMPFLRPILRRGALKLQTAGAFDVASAQRSLDESLRKLGTDYVDILMLHECTTEQAMNPDLKEFLARSVKEGRIRHWGVASHRAVTRDLVCENWPPAVVQFADNPVMDSADLIDQARAVASVFTHSTLNHVPAIVRDVMTDPDAANRWSAAFGQNVTRHGAVGEALLALALERNKDGCVLISSRNPDRVRQNARVVSTGKLVEDAVATTQRLVAESKVRLHL